MKKNALVIVAIVVVVGVSAWVYVRQMPTEGSPQTSASPSAESSIETSAFEKSYQLLKDQSYKMSVYSDGYAYDWYQKGDNWKMVSTYDTGDSMIIYNHTAQKLYMLDPNSKTAVILPVENTDDYTSNSPLLYNEQFVNNDWTVTSGSTWTMTSPINGSQVTAEFNGPQGLITKLEYKQGATVITTTYAYDMVGTVADSEFEVPSDYDVQTFPSM